MDNLDLKVGGRYRLIRKLGEGGFGVVYEGLDLETQDSVAIKLEDVRTDPSFLEGEVEVYKSLDSSHGIPRIHWHGQECDFNALVLDLLGPSLEDVFNHCGRVFSLKTTLMLADQLIKRLQLLNTRNILHRDVKPENFLLGCNKSGNIVYATDFGISWCEFTRFPKTSSRLIGTARFASINGHLGNEQSPYDDLESLGYMPVYFLRGLPWQGLAASSQEAKEELILSKKRTMKAKALCRGLPSEFAMYFDIIRSSDRSNTPPYKRILDMFRRLFRRENFEYDKVFDWTVLKFLENQELQK